MPIRIIKIHPTQLKPAFYGWCLLATWFNFIIGFQNLEKALRIDHGIIYFIINPVQRANRGRDIIKEQHMVHDHADTHLSIQYKIGSQNNNQDYTDLFNKGF